MNELHHFSDFYDLDNHICGLAGEFILLYDETHLMYIRKKKYDPNFDLKYDFKNQFGITNP